MQERLAECYFQTLKPHPKLNLGLKLQRSLIEDGFSSLLVLVARIVSRHGIHVVAVDIVTGLRVLEKTQTNPKMTECNHYQDRGNIQVVNSLEKDARQEPFVGDIWNRPVECQKLL